MLTLGSIVTGQCHYYTQLGREDYYLEGGEPPGYWRGSGAEALALRGQIEDEHFHNLFHGYSADGEEKLIRSAGTETHRPGYDLTFSAEKDVSVLWALADEDTRRKIEEVQRQAVDAALDYLEREAGWTRIGHAGETAEKAKLMFACFEHGTSRAQDPNLHTHCIALNLCVGNDGKTRAIRDHDLFLHQKSAGALYRMEMSRLLGQSLGLVTRATEDGFYRIAGASDELRKAFSKRREQIEAELEEKGFSSAAAAALANQKTRHRKGHMNRGELDKLWREEAKSLGHEPDMLLESVRKQIDTGRAPNLDKIIRKEAQELANTRSWFHERDLLGAVAAHCQGGWFSIEEVEDRVRKHLDSDRTQGLGLRGEYREFTDKEYYVRTERSLFRLSDELASNRFHTVDEETVKKYKLRFGGSLNEEQRKAVDHLTKDPGGLKMLSGLAGTGKTTTLRVCGEIWREEGYKVVGAALAGKAARELEDGARIKSETIRKRELQIDPSLGHRMWHHAYQLYRAGHKWKTNRLDRLKLDRKTVLVIDEAGMLGAKDTVSMLRKAKKAGAKVVLVGDERQLPAIEAVSGFNALQDRHGSASLTDIVRQRDPWMREAVTKFAEGDSKTGLSMLLKRGRLHLGGRGREATMKKLIDVWSEKTPTAKDVSEAAILAGTRKDARRLNELAQEVRRNRGDLGRFGVSLGREEIDGKRRKPLKAYRGDRVMFMKNNRGLDVSNGETGTVKRVDAPPLGRGRMWVEMDDGRKVEVNLARFDHLTLGYAATTHKLQGASVEQSFVYTNPKDASREMSYVQVSRHRGDVNVFMPGHAKDEDLAELKCAMEKSTQRVLAAEREKEISVRVREEEEARNRELARERTL